MIVEDNVVSFPALPASGRPWVRIVSCNPAEVKDPDVPPPFSGYPVADRSEWDAYREEYARALGPLQSSFDEFCRERGAPPLDELEFIHSSPAPQPLALSERGRLRAPAPARRPLAQPRVERPRHRRRLGAARAARLRDGPARLPQPRLARLGRRRADAHPDRDARRLALPGDRLDGPAARRARARPEHGRRGVPAADLDPAPGRPGDHPRRQQHGHRVPALRQADGRAAAVLGPVRQRAADRRDGLRRPACRPTRTSRRSCARRSTGCSPTSRSRRTSTPSRGGCAPSPAPSAPPI